MYNFTVCNTDHDTFLIIQQSIYSSYPQAAGSFPVISRRTSPPLYMSQNRYPDIKLRMLPTHLLCYFISTTPFIPFGYNHNPTGVIRIVLFIHILLQFLNIIFQFWNQYHLCSARNSRTQSYKTGIPPHYFHKKTDDYGHWPYL